MKNRKYSYSAVILITAFFIAISYSCERKFDNMIPADYPNDGDVFIDGFSPGLAYEAWGDVTAFEVDKREKYKGEASMRFAVPDEGQTGGYAGGRFITSSPRDLSEYDALTFWAKATKAASIDVIGFGNNNEGSKYQASIVAVKVNTNWKKYIIPLPDASKLIMENGMLYYSEAPEDGSGYTFWLDEVQFEKLGTIAHAQPKIFNGEDRISTAFNSVKIPVTGLSYIANLPNAVNQIVEVAPSYFNFSSSDEGVALVDEEGLITVVGGGTSVITASLSDEQASGTLTVESSGEFIHAPDPTIHPDSVISIFSNQYKNVPVEYYNGYWQPYQTTLSSDFTVNGNDVLNYTNFNFVGIQFTVPTIDASAMTHLHVDIFVPNDVNPGDKLNIKIIDQGADGTFDDPNSDVAYLIQGSELISKNWISVDISLDGLSTKANLAQIVFENLDSGLSGFYADNIYLYNTGEIILTGPQEAAPAPTHDPSNVISIYSDSYTNLEGTDYPDWGQATIVSDVFIEGNPTLKFAELNFQGIQLAASLNASELGFLHIDYWTDNSDKLNVFLISSGPVETASALAVPTSGWASADIPLNDFSPVDLEDIIQMKFDGNGDIYLDNIYFYKQGGTGATEPTEAAPSPPAREPADVISVFSDAYTNVEVSNFDPDWGQSTDATTVDIAGNSTLKYANFNYQGTELGSSQDASGMEYLHIDMWTPDATDVKVTPINASGSPAEALVALTPINAEQWNSYDIPLSDFTNSGMSLNEIIQLKFDGQGGTNPSNIWLDNIYFYREGSVATEPAEAAPAPPVREPENVISVFSDVYTNVEISNFDPEWGQSTDATTVDIAGNSTLKYANFNYQGTELAGAQDASAMQYLHVDMWTADATDVKVTPINASGSPAEFLVSLTPIASGQWNSYDIPLTDFTNGGMSLNEIVQLKFDGQGGTNPSNIWLDNIYFYTEGMMETEPTEAAPSPPSREPENVISVFSDVYTNVEISNFDPEWGQSTDATTVDIAGNSTLKYANFNYQGTELTSAQDASAMQYLHVDMWTADATDVKVTPINASGSPAEFLVSLTPIASGQWNSYDIPLTDFTNSGMSLNEIVQLKFDGQGGTNPSNIWLDNIYFYKEGGTGGTVIFEEDFSDTLSVVGWERIADANSSEASIEWISDGGVDGGAMKLIASNPTDGAGKAYIFQLTEANLDFDNASEVILSFDLKLAAPLVAAAVHLQTDITGVGVVNNYDLQAQGTLNEDTWTSYTFDFTGVDSESNTFMIHFNFASGAVAGAGGELLIDNIKLGKK